jgi:uncharacterized protein (TIRG00374 family)
MRNKKTIFYLIVIILLIVAVLPKRNQLIAGLNTVKTADMSWILLAMVSLTGTYFVVAYVYKILAKRPVNYFTTVLVQVACSFANRLLPSGIGGLGLNVDYLIKNKHKPAESASVVTVNSLIAFASHFLLIMFALIISESTFGSIFKGISVPWWVIIAVALIAFAIIIILDRQKKLKRKIEKLIKDTLKNIADYHKKPINLVVGLFMTAVVTLLYVLAFYACAYSVGLQLTIVQAFLIYTFGTLVGAATMTPGGLGGVEAGLVTGLVAVKADYSLAFSAVIIYRLLTFWLPIIPGYFAFWILRKYKRI